MASYNWTDGELVTAEKLNAYSKGMEQIKTDTEAAQAAAETARDTAAQKANNAEQSAQSAENARAAAEEKANTASTAASNAEVSASDAAAAKTAAETAKTAAETAKAEAQTAATDASGSKTAAEQSAAAAAQSAESAAQSASSASENATAAQQSKEAAALSESNALASENAAAESAASALEGKNATAESANAAAASETNAATSATAALSAQKAAEAARDQAQTIVGGDFANHTLITIPAGRMRGDVDGDGKFTQEDTTRLNNGPTSVESITKYYSMSFSTQFPDGNIPIDFLAADINGDNKINISDLTQYNDLIISGTKKPGAYTEVTGNWTNNPNYATEDGQFYTDIPITGMTTSHSASVIVKGTFENGFFPKAECIEGAIRIYAKLCPIEALTAVVSWGTGDGTAVITTESKDLTVYDEHIANVDIHVTADEKAAWSEKEVFVITVTRTTADDGTVSYSADKTFEEIREAANNGKMCTLQNNTSTYMMIIGGGTTQARFSRCNASKIQTFVVSSANAWSYGEYLALPSVTADDNGKILQVVNGVWTAVTPS